MLGPCRVLLLSLLLCCSVLQDLALVQLMQKQLLPYLRAGAASVPVAVDRASRVLTDIARLKGLTQGEMSSVAYFTAQLRLSRFVLRA